MARSNRAELAYGKYKIIAGRAGSAFKAVAYLGKRKLLEMEAETLDSAIQTLKEELDEAGRAKLAARQNGVPTAEEYREALEAIAPEITPAQLAMLKAHYRARAADSLANIPDHTLGTEELAEAAGYSDYSAVNLQYGRLGRRLAEHLDFTPSPEDGSGEVVWTSTLATGKKFGGCGLWIWTLRPEVAKALEDLNMV